MFWTLNGANADGTEGSTNAEAPFCTAVIVPSQTSILPLLKLAANSRGAVEVPPKAQPLYTALFLELSARMIALFGFTDEFQPEMTPSSEQNMNVAALPVATLNALEFVLIITPVTGAVVVAPPAAGIVTTSAIAFPVPS